MSPASKSKSKDKSTPRAGKEQPKVSIKSSPVHSNGGNGSSSSAYNPALGTFHTLDISSSLTPSSNGRFRTIDDPEDHSGNSPGTTAEYDSFSNNGSCSGESEDQKEKLSSTTSRIDSIPGCDIDKRDKIRQKNEKKHQRQKEKRAQDLHERCNAFLTSRKLETLSHQLVMMGFPADRATMAIIINEGRMEESVAWLLHEEGEDNKQQVSVKLEDKCNLKVDISDELARIAALEAKYKCTKQDVERAVVAFEGDLSKAEGNLKLQKQAVSAAAAPKLEEPVDSAGLNDKIAAPNPIPGLIRSPIKGATAAAVSQQQRKDERDLNYKTLVPGASLPESANRNLQHSLKKMQPNSTDWSRTQVSPIDNRWMTMSSAPSVSYPPLVSPVQASVSLLKSEPQFGATTMGHEVKTNFQLGALKEPFVVMRRPKQNLSASNLDVSVSPPASTGWYPNGSPSMEVLAGANGGMRHSISVMDSSISPLRHIYPQNNLHPMPSGRAELSASSGWSSQSWNASGASSTSSLAVPSSLGLFTGWGFSGSSGSSQNNWNTGGSTLHRDYTSIDWSLDLTPLRPPLKNDTVSDTWSTMFMGGNGSRALLNVGSGGAYHPGLQDRGGFLTDPQASPSSHDWTNPFEGRDLFRIPRKHVTSPPSL